MNGDFKLDVPVYTVWGACEDVRVLEKFRSGEYKVDNLHIIDEVNSRLLDVAGVKLRLLGLGGAVVTHKLFDNGEGKTYIAGGQGTMWTTFLQIGALVDTANRVYDPSETRIFLTHASPARDGLLNQLSVTLKADFSISAGLHFRYGSSYNEFSVNPSLDHYRGKLAASKASFNDVWETVRTDVEQAIAPNESHKSLLQAALEIVERMPSQANGPSPFGGPVGGSPAAGQVDESAFKNMWNFNLADAAFGYLVLEIDAGRIGTEMRAQGFNFAHRSTRPVAAQPVPQQTVNVPATAPATNAVTGGPPSGPAQNRTPAFSAPTQPFPQVPQQSQRNNSQPQRPTQSGQQTGAKPPTSNSPAPPSTQAKPMTPQPSTTQPLAGSNTHSKPGTPSLPAANGGAGARASDTEAKSKPSTPPIDRKAQTQLYVMFADSEEQARQCIAEQDRDKIKSISKQGSRYNNFTISFESHDIAAEVLRRAQVEARNVKNSQNKAPRVEWFKERLPYHQRESSTSGIDARGGSATATAPGRAGYTSGASDSEGGRGRGGFGRGRGSVRGDRGDRGGRGRGMGRGGFAGKTDGAADSKPESKPTEATPAQEST